MTKEELIDKEEDMYMSMALFSDVTVTVKEEVKDEEVDAGVQGEMVDEEVVDDEMADEAIILDTLVQEMVDAK